LNDLITFIGYGEAAYHISKGLVEEGVTGMAAYDVMQNHETRGDLIRRRAKEVGVTLASNAMEACSSARFVASLNSAEVAFQVARSILPDLAPGQVYVDMNSVSPTVLTEMDAISRPEGVRLCDAALLGSVPKTAHKTKMFLSGDGALAFYEAFVPYHMKLSVLNAPPGGASAIKMFRSVFSKGIPQLMLECMIAAAEYGVLEEMVGTINDSLKDRTLEDYADETLFRTLIHARRRAAEMANVASTIEDMKLDASIARAVQQRLERLDKGGYAQMIAPEGHPGYREVIDIVRSGNYPLQ
jgi:3-hydroxyisobutyrate dehydrogenase-like beta-hydroxyacid dehydrogenase